MTTTHKMTDTGAACGADSWECAISWDNVTCEDCLTHKGHTHTYRSDLADMWCVQCQTVTDYCQQINPF